MQKPHTANLISHSLLSLGHTGGFYTHCVLINTSLAMCSKCNLTQDSSR
jgi:hypothetical protein